MAAIPDPLTASGHEKLGRLLIEELSNQMLKCPTPGKSVTEHIRSVLENFSAGVNPSKDLQNLVTSGCKAICFAAMEKGFSGSSEGSQVTPSPAKHPAFSSGVGAR